MSKGWVEKEEEKAARMSCCRVCGWVEEEKEQEGMGGWRGLGGGGCTHLTKLHKNIE